MLLNDGKGLTVYYNKCYNRNNIWEPTAGRYLSAKQVS